MPNISSATTILGVQLTEGAAPATPASGFFVLYASTGSVLRGLDDSGNDYPYATGSIPADVAIKTADETITGVWTFTTVSGSPSMNGSNIIDLREENITVGSILLRNNNPTTISQDWAFSVLPTLGTGSGYVKLTTGSISSTASIPETDIADGTVFPRLDASETITGDAYTFKAINVGRVQVLSLSGTYNDYAPTGAAGCCYLDVVPATAANVVFTGLDFTQANGRILFLFNNQGYSGGTITFKHADAGSSAANQFFTPGSTDYVLNPGYGCVLVYGGGKWLVMGRA